ncbi:MAG: alpha-E domain-containing protein [Fimbriimonadaceae bacterium]|nr:alpha-E domain-containing protein [Chthonomonadaceae bacterium]MCO5298086.1 alpha-E domain-containing protein [Fimbriimonadaceae bacterium]
MMLARVADALYWMGRYIERAENVTRLLMVASDFSVELEGLDDRLAHREWEAVLAALPGASPVALGKSSGLIVPHVRSLLLDEENPMSVFSSLARARDNARSIGETLTREVFTTLNETHRELRDRRKGLRNAVQAHDLASHTHLGILTMLGAIEHTLTRDQGWTYMKLGEAMERSQRSLLVMRVQLPVLSTIEHEVDPSLFYAGWRSLLLSLASLENYRRAHGAALDPKTVTRFLLFDPSTPRAVRCGVGRMKAYLSSLPAGDSGLRTAARVMGKLDADMTYDEERVMELEDVGPFLNEVLHRLSETHDLITRQGAP